MAAYNLSMWIEVTTLMFPQFFLLIASVSNTMKNICFLLASASRARINLNFARNNNMADIQGKSVSQFTASTLAGTVMGMALTSFIDVSKLSQIVPCFLALTAFQLGLVHVSTK
jgi:uncharacterized membrane protein YfcA